jgi:hypothetical protein
MRITFRTLSALLAPIALAGVLQVAAAPLASAAPRTVGHVLTATQVSDDETGLATTGKATVSPSSLRAGECLTMSGAGYKPGATLQIRKDGVPLKTVKADNNGNFSTRICFGTDAVPGQHQLCARGTGANDSARTECATVTVLGFDATRVPHTGKESLPFTGANAIPQLVLTGLALLLFGAFLVWRSRSKRHHREQSTALG